MSSYIWPNILFGVEIDMRDTDIDDINDLYELCNDEISFEGITFSPYDDDPSVNGLGVHVADLSEDDWLSKFKEAMNNEQQLIERFNNEIAPKLKELNIKFDKPTFIFTVHCG